MAAAITIGITSVYVPAAVTVLWVLAVCASAIVERDDTGPMPMLLTFLVITLGGILLMVIWLGWILMRWLA